MIVCEFYVQLDELSPWTEGIVHKDGTAIGICHNGQLYSKGGKFATDWYIQNPTKPYQPGQPLYAKDNLFTPDESETKQIVATLVSGPGPFSSGSSGELVMGNFIEIKLEI